jgi:hypothetical protein
MRHFVNDEHMQQSELKTKNKKHENQNLKKKNLTKSNHAEGMGPRLVQRLEHLVKRKGVAIRYLFSYHRLTRQHRRL